MSRFALLLLFCALAPACFARDIGAVTTAIKILGPNHKIVVTAFDDPKIMGITCYVARPRTGGIKGAIGFAEDPSIGSVSCVQTGPVIYKEPIEADTNGEEVFDESRSLIFKSLSINRLYDKSNASLVYLVRTTRIIEGSPTTSVSVVARMVWDGTPPGKPLLDD